MLSERLTERMIITPAHGADTEMFENVPPGHTPHPKRIWWGVGLVCLLLGGGLSVMHIGDVVHALDGLGYVRLSDAKMTVPVTHAAVPHHETIKNKPHMLPPWVEAGIRQVTSHLQSVTKSLGVAQAETVKLRQDRLELQKQVGILTAGNMQLKAQLHHAEHLVATERLELQARVQTHSALPQVHDAGGSMMAHPSSVPNGTSPGSIIALANKSLLKSASVTHPVTSTAKGWLTIAVHGSQAVVQTPAGQVAMVHVGSRLDGAMVTRIDGSRKAVVLNHHQWVYPPK